MATTGLDFTGNGMDWSQLEKNLGENVLGKKKKNYADDRFWKLSRDENDNGAAIIRLIPDPTGTPFIQRFSHSFSSFDMQSKKKRYYINESPQSINLPCPVADLWSGIYNLGSEDAKQEARAFNRKLNFIANIKVIKDPANPENEGKIFLWQFGTKLKDKFMQALNPSEQDLAMGEKPKQLFNPLTGCNIKLKIKPAGGFLNYDDTTIENESSIYQSQQEAEQDILSNAYKLEEFVKPEAFLPYEELKSKLEYVLETYEPKLISKEVFNRVVAETIGKTEVAPVAEPATIDTGLGLSNSTPTTPPTPTGSIGIEPKPEPVTTPSSVPNSTAPSTQAADDDLSFLDDL